MKISRKVTQGFLLAGSLLLVIGLLPGTAQARFLFNSTIRVNCAKGETITRALTRGLWAQLRGRPLTIIVRGTCREYVTIRQDDVTLQGRPNMDDGVVAPDSDRPTIQIEGARRVVIDNLDVWGGKHGINGVGGANFTVQNSDIHDNDLGGIRVAGSSAVIVDNHIHHNFDGVKVVESASARIGLTQASEAGGNTIQYNEQDGIEIANSSTASMFGNTVKWNQIGIGIFRATGRLYGQNTIQNNSRNGIQVATGGALRQGPSVPIIPPPDLGTNSDIIRGNTNHGIWAISSFLDIRDAIIMRNGLNGIAVDFHSTLLIRNSEGNTEISWNILNGIALRNDSSLWLIDLDPQVSITRNGDFGILCLDGESSFTGNTTGVRENTDGQISRNCTSF